MAGVRPKEYEKLIVKGKRVDGRKADELRPIIIKAGVVPNAQGSAYYKQGETEVIAAVYGPREVLPRHLTENDRAYLNCVYTMAPFATPDRVRPGPSRRSTEISKVITDALAPAIMLEKYPKTKIDVFLTVTTANGGTRTASICAASVALADAGIEMRDLVVSVASGKADETLVLDLNEPEDNFGETDMPLAVMPRTNEITLLQMDGLMTKDEVKKVMEMSIKAAQDIYSLQSKALKERYKTESEVAE